MDYWLPFNTPQGNTLDWTLFLDLYQPSLNGRMKRWGQALEPGLVKKMEIYTAVLCRLKAQWMERTLELNKIRS